MLTLCANGYEGMSPVQEMIDRTTRGPSPSRSEGQRWAQKASLATPPAARVRERRGSERGKPSHSSLIPLLPP